MTKKTKETIVLALQMWLNNIQFNRAKIAIDHKVLIVGQATAVKFYPPPGTNLIRIKGNNPTGVTEFESLEYAKDFNSILELNFDDIDNPSDGHVITDKDVSSIIQFFKKHIDTNGSLLMIHCQGGISRSTAVGCAYGYFTQNPQLELDIRSSGFAVPNSKVYRMLIEHIHDFGGR